MHSYALICGQVSYAKIKMMSIRPSQRTNFLGKYVVAAKFDKFYIMV